MALTQSTRDVVNVADVSVAIKNDSTVGGITQYVNTTFAPLASPAMSGVPTVPTAAVNTANTQVASTAFVLNQITSGLATTGAVSITNNAPGISMIDTTGMSAFIVSDNNAFYIRRNATTGATTWDAGPNGRDPMTLNLSTGTVVFSGDIGAYSDIRLKKNINTITDALAIVNLMRGVTYEMLNGTPSFGFIAQEVEEVFPVAVKTDHDGYKSVSYANMTAVLVEAVKSLTYELGKVRAELNELKGE